MQGREHHLSVDARWGLDRLRKVGALSAEERAAWCRTTQEVLDEVPRLEAKGRLEEALALRWKLLELRQRTLGKEHPLVSTSLNGMALNLTDQRRFAEAEPIPSAAIQFRTSSSGGVAAAGSSGAGELRTVIAELTRQRLAAVAPHLEEVRHLIVLPLPALSRAPVELLN